MLQKCLFIFYDFVYEDFWLASYKIKLQNINFVNLTKIIFPYDYIKEN